MTMFYYDNQMGANVTFTVTPAQGAALSVPLPPGGKTSGPAPGQGQWAVHVTYGNLQTVDQVVAAGAPDTLLTCMVDPNCNCAPILVIGPAVVGGGANAVEAACEQLDLVAFENAMDVALALAGNDAASVEALRKGLKCLRTHNFAKNVAVGDASAQIYDKQEELQQKYAQAVIDGLEAGTLKLPPGDKVYAASLYYDAARTQPATPDAVPSGPEYKTKSTSANWEKAYDFIKKMVLPTLPAVPQINVDPQPSLNKMYPTAGSDPESIDSLDAVVKADYAARYAANQQAAALYAEQTALRALAKWTQATKLRLSLEEVVDAQFDDDAAKNPEDAATVQSTLSAGQLDLRMEPEVEVATRAGKYGAGERIRVGRDDLHIFSENQLPDVRVFLRSGSGDLDGTVGASNTYVCGVKSETAKLDLVVVSGLSAGTIIDTVDVPTVVPTGVRFARAPNTGILHTQNYFSIGFKGEYFVEPANVSFSNLYFSEGPCPSTETGNPFMQAFHANHAQGSAHTIGTIAQGNKVNAIDTVSNTWNGQTVFNAGTFSWPIPCQYSASATGPWTAFDTNTHYAESFQDANNGNAWSAKIRKIPTNGSSGVTDIIVANSAPSSNY